MKVSFLILLNDFFYQPVWFRRSHTSINITLIFKTSHSVLTEKGISTFSASFLLIITPFSTVYCLPPFFHREENSDAEKCNGLGITPTNISGYWICMDVLWEQEGQSVQRGF